MVATEAGQGVVHEHTEHANDDPGKPGDEELYIVVQGRFRVYLDDEQVEVRAGLANDAFLARAKRQIDEEKDKVMADRGAFLAWLDRLFADFAAEAKRRNVQR